jgi:hypothetical protein
MFGVISVEVSYYLRLYLVFCHGAKVGNNGE